MLRLLLIPALVAADFDLTLLVTREVRGAAYPVDRFGNQCNGPMPPPPPPPLLPDQESGEAPPAPPFAPTCSVRRLSSNSGPGRLFFCSRLPSIPRMTQCTGGAARRRVLIGPGATATGAAARLSTPNNVVSLDCGAFFAGSGKFFAAFGGNASSEFFAESAYDAYSLTYRDFAAGSGPATLAGYLHRARSLQPALPRAVVTNFNSTGEEVLAPYLEPSGYTLVQLAGGRTLAVLALADPTHLRATYPEYADRLLDFWPAVARTLASLRRLPTPPDVIALLITAFPLTSADVAAAGSADAANDAAIDRLVNDAIGVDIVILSGVEIATNLPHLRRNHAGDEVLVVPSAGQTHGRAVENITATFSDAGLLRGAQAGAERIDLDCMYPEDVSTATRVAERYTEMDTTLGVTIGHVGRQLDSPRSAAPGVAAADGLAPSGCSSLGAHVACGCRVAACLQGAFVADAIVSVTGADFGLINGGAIKATISSTPNSDGYVPVTTGDLIELLPFANEVVTLSVTGAQVRAALANGISRLGLADAHTHPNGRFPQVSRSLSFDWYFREGQPRLGPVYVGVGSSSVLLNDTQIYRLASNEYLRGGGDGYGVLSGVAYQRHGSTQAETVASFINSRCRACSPFTGHGVGCEADCAPPADWAGHIVQQPDIINVQIGLLCKTGAIGTANVLAAERELCDHMQNVIGLINDKNDGFLDNLLPNTHIEFAEAKIGCVDGLYESAVAQVQAALPQMLFAIGPICSTDTMAITQPSFRDQFTFHPVVISASSTAPSVQDESVYTNVARLATNENFVGQGSALLAARYNWKRIAVVSDDSSWAVEAAQAFVNAHVTSEDPSRVIINMGDTVTQGISTSAFDDESIDVEAILRRLQSLDAHVVYLVTQPRISERIFSAVYDTGLLYGQGYAWIVAWLSEDFLRSPDGSISASAVRGAEGVLGLIESNGAGTPMHEQYRSYWLPRSSVEGCSSTTAYCDGDGSPTGSPPGYSVGAIDSIIIAARALSTNLRDVGFRSNPDAVYAAIKNLGSTEGVSGQVTLDASADRLGNFEVRNMQISAARRQLAGRGLPWLGAEREAWQLEAAVRRALSVPLSSSTAAFQLVGSWQGDGSQPIAVDNVIFPGGVTEVPPDADPSSAPIIVAVMVSVVVVIAIAALLMAWQRRHAQKQIRFLKKVCACTALSIPTQHPRPLELCLLVSALTCVSFDHVKWMAGAGELQEYGRRCALCQRGIRPAPGRRLYLWRFVASWFGRCQGGKAAP